MIKEPIMGGAPENELKNDTLPEKRPLKKINEEMKINIENQLREAILAGEVNLHEKIDSGSFKLDGHYYGEFALRENGMVDIYIHDSEDSLKDSLSRPQPIGATYDGVLRDIPNGTSFKLSRDEARVLLEKYEEAFEKEEEHERTHEDGSNAAQFMHPVLEQLKKIAGEK